MNIAKYRKKLALVVLIVALIVLVALLVVPAFAADSEKPIVLEPFFGASAELEADLEQIAMSDTRIQSLVSDRVYEYVIDENHIVKNKGYNLAVGVRLKDDVDKEQFKDWIKGGRMDQSVVAEFVGCLSVGYNDKYTIVIDKSQRRVTDFSLISSRQVRIPELSKAEMNVALATVISDPRICELLEGKDYEIAPGGRIGVWHAPYEEGKGIQKMGVSLQIQFIRPYQIDYVFPGISPDDGAGADPQSYQEISNHYSGEVEYLSILVDLGKGKVVSISPFYELDT